MKNHNKIMRKFVVNVNGTSYDVEVEEVGGGAPAAAPVSSAPAPKAAPKSAPKAASKPAPAGAKTIPSPMPGTIMDIRVSVGDSVKKGAILCILEAMKMENEILAPNDGTVAAVHVTKGASVDSGDVLVSLS